MLIKIGFCYLYKYFILHLTIGECGKVVYVKGECCILRVSNYQEEDCTKTWRDQFNET